MATPPRDISHACSLAHTHTHTHTPLLSRTNTHTHTLPSLARTRVCMWGGMNNSDRQHARTHEQQAAPRRARRARPQQPHRHLHRRARAAVGAVVRHGGERVRLQLVQNLAQLELALRQRHQEAAQPGRRGRRRGVARGGAPLCMCDNTRTDPSVRPFNCMNRCVARESDFAVSGSDACAST